MKNSEYFKKEIQYIKYPIIRNIVIKTLDNSKEYIVHIPASSSGKYHPSYALGEGGLYVTYKSYSWYSKLAYRKRYFCKLSL